jgi:hypothetical protein
MLLRREGSSFATLATQEEGLYPMIGREATACCYSGITAVPLVIPERKRSNSFYLGGRAVYFFIQGRKRTHSCYLG